MAFLRPAHPAPLLTHPPRPPSPPRPTPPTYLAQLQAGARLVHGVYRRVAGRDVLQAKVLERGQRAAPQPRGQVSAAVVGDLGAAEVERAEWRRRPE